MTDMNQIELRDSAALRVLRAALWHETVPSLTDEEWRSVYATFRDQGILAIPAEILEKAETLPEGLFAEWKKQILRQVSHFYHLAGEESVLLEQLEQASISVAVLKGSAAAKYYPHPEYRAMGDIDIIPARDRYEEACSLLTHHGFADVTKETPDHRHIQLSKRDITVEVHRYFAKVNDPACAACIDELVYNGISADGHHLPDDINGLTILAHIGQHLEKGLDMRHVIDWMQFVHVYLNDGKRQTEFARLIRKTGLMKLAVSLTAMCHRYLGLPEEPEWCRTADDDLCDALLRYILKYAEVRAPSQQIFSTLSFMNIRHPVAFMKDLQSYGLKNWRAVERYRALRPFAWMYSAVHCVRKLFRYPEALRSVRQGLREGNQRTDLLDRLGTRQTAKGLAYYKDGKYIK